MKRRRILILLCCISLLIRFPMTQATVPNGTLEGKVFRYETSEYSPVQNFPIVRLEWNGETLEGEMPGMVLGNRTMAPLRLLAEKLGAEVTWHPEQAQVMVRGNGKTILLTLGSDLAEVDGEEEQMPDGVAATMVFYQGQGYTMVPLRFFSETLGCQVFWQQESYTASVFEAGYIAENSLEKLDTPVNPEKFLIALDAGHGGVYSGAFYENTAEKDLNLAIVLKLEKILTTLGYQTVLTRSGDEDVGLLQRSVLANGAKADLFVSIHCNAAENNPDFQGLYVYHFPGSTAGKELAQQIQTPACQFTGAIDRKINSANFSVLRNTKMPAVLVETGFMSCHEELMRLKSDTYQEQMALGIAQGIVRYLNALA